MQICLLKALFISSHIFFVTLLVVQPSLAYDDEGAVGFQSSKTKLQSLTDSLPSQLEKTKKRSDFGVLVNFRLGLGRHDNLTKAKSWTGPELKSSNTHFTVLIESGVTYKKASSSFFISYLAPIPRIQNISGYGHKAEAVDIGLLFKMILISMKSKVNFTPAVGYMWAKEIANIYDPNGSPPDSLDLTYADNGMSFGVDFQYRLAKSGRVSEHRIVFGYLHENLRREADRYQFEWRFLGFNKEKGQGGKMLFDDFDFLAIGFEHVRWSDGRNDWFLIGSFGGVFK